MLENDMKMHYKTYAQQYNNNNNFQCGSRFRVVWGDPAVGNLTSTSISTRREVDSKRPTKRVLWKYFINESFCENIKYENILWKKDSIARDAWDK